jgi:hypothetical protein
MKLILNGADGVINIDHITRIKFLMHENYAEIIEGFRVYLSDNAGPIDIMYNDAGFEDLKEEIEEAGGLVLVSVGDINRPMKRNETVPYPTATYTLDGRPWRW